MGTMKALRFERTGSLSELALATVPDLPVDHYISLEQGPLPESVHRMTGGRGADVVLDVVGGPIFEACLQSLAQRGRQVAIASTGNPRVSFNLTDFYHREGRLLGVDTLHLAFADIASILRGLLPGIEQGVFLPPEVETVPLEGAVDGYRRLNGGTARKKLVIVM